MALSPIMNVDQAGMGRRESESKLSQVETLNWIQDLVREELDDDSVVLVMNAPFGDVPGWDSLAHVGIIVAIEKRLGRKFAANDIEALETVGDLVDLAHRRET
ncbi:MAG: acyl carrier protein [Proteobacteria bacterium]|nr:acyl carrier protein [Pseudomonadota bacterium]